MSVEFRECDTCAAKPGSPYLCAGCLNNRNTINKLEVELQHLRQKQDIIRGVLDL